MVQDAIKYLQNNNFSIQNCLDIGCNRGYYSAIFGDLGAQVDAVDPYLRSDLVIRHPNVTYHKADFLKWTVDKKYDVILFFEVYEHIPPESREIFIEKIKQSLNPGGIILFSGPNCISLFYSGGFIKSLIPRILGKIPEIDWHYKIPFFFYRKLFKNDESQIISWQTNGITLVFSNKIELMLGKSCTQRLLNLDRCVSRLTSGLGANYFCIVQMK
ncbi:class I SAM-dependent methyltransferase [Methanofollis aquaemaris]|nr:class I SAM-dependent methyltransferase [Methanofollis aquaemaris]